MHDMPCSNDITQLEFRIKDALAARDDVSGWVVSTTDLAREELYLVGRDIEQLRTVHDGSVMAVVHVEDTEDGKPMTGSVSRVFTPDMGTTAVEAQIDEMVFAAGLALNPRYRLDTPRDNDLAYPNCDEAIARDMRGTLHGVYEQTLAAVEEEEGVKAASAEIFLTHSAFHEMNSMGLDHEGTSTRVTYELVLLAGEGDGEVESHLLRHERWLDKLDLPSAIAAYARYARENVDAVLPPSGVFDVVITEEGLENIFDLFQMKTAGAAIYNKMSDWTVGRPIVDEAVGDRLTIGYDPTLPGGLCTTKYDNLGTLLEPITFIEDGVFTRIVADKRHADYLDVPVTGMGTNIVVGSGQKSFEELVGDGPTFVLSRFSSFTPNAVTGGFSGEVRNGLLYRDGTVTPVKGGSVTGMLAEALREAYLSTETVQAGRYVGPRYIKLCKVNIAGA